MPPIPSKPQKTLFAFLQKKSKLSLKNNASSLQKDYVQKQQLATQKANIDDEEEEGSELDDILLKRGQKFSSIDNENEDNPMKYRQKKKHGKLNCIESDDDEENQHKREIVSAKNNKKSDKECKCDFVLFNLS